uniref:uncharacterized protein LOC120335027 n=1 Tax=Styela clava TaxID=7725 RepID=UPI001939F4E9|nr:uncharacterized protein LOC120335027 [Styela clava]
MADETYNVIQVCQKGFKAYLIGGFGADINEVEDAAWEICKKLHNFSERKRIHHYRDVESIVDTAGSLTEVPALIVLKIHKILFHMPHCKNGITRIIFAHSHGAKIVRTAIGENSLYHYFVKHRLNESGVDFSNKLNRIKDNLAVFTLGGIDTIPKEYAKICLNLRFIQDVKSKFGNKVYGGSSENSEIIKFHNGEVESQSRPSSESISGRLENFFQLKTLKTASTEGTKHLLFDYTRDSAITRFIWKTLRLQGDSVPCGCTETTTKNEPENMHWIKKHKNDEWVKICDPIYSQKP